MRPPSPKARSVLADNLPMRETRLRCRGISTRDDVFPYTAITVQEQSEPRASNSLLCLWTRAAHLLPL
jgi:hypothetical protein